MGKQRPMSELLERQQEVSEDIARLRKLAERWQGLVREKDMHINGLLHALRLVITEYGDRGEEHDVILPAEEQKCPAIKHAMGVLHHMVNLPRGE